MPHGHITVFVKKTKAVCGNVIMYFCIYIFLSETVILVVYVNICCVKLFFGKISFALKVLFCILYCTLILNILIDHALQKVAKMVLM